MSAPTNLPHCISWSPQLFYYSTRKLTGVTEAKGVRTMFPVPITKRDHITIIFDSTFQCDIWDLKLICPKFNTKISPFYFWEMDILNIYLLARRKAQRLMFPNSWRSCVDFRKRVTFPRFLYFSPCVLYYLGFSLFWGKTLLFFI